MPIIVPNKINAELLDDLDSTDFLDKATYDSDENGIVDSAEELDDGSNSVTAAQARSHIDDTSNPHGVTAAQVGALDVSASISDLTDVTIGTPVDNQFLKYQSGVWVNDEVDFSMLTSVPSPVISFSGDVSGSVTLTSLGSGSGTLSIAAGSVSGSDIASGTITGSNVAASTISSSNLVAFSIDFLSDVDTVTASPSDGQALIWSSSGSEWVPGNVATSGTAADDENIILATQVFG